MYDPLVIVYGFSKAFYGAAVRTCGPITAATLIYGPLSFDFRREGRARTAEAAPAVNGT